MGWVLNIYMYEWDLSLALLVSVPFICTSKILILYIEQNEQMNEY